MLKFDIPEVSTIRRSEEGVRFPILSLKTHEQAEVRGQKLSITLIGPDSKAYGDFVREQHRRVIELSQAKEQLPAGEDLAMERLVFATKGWDGFTLEDGAPIPFTKENVQAFYEQVPRARMQMEARFDDVANFTEASPTV